MTTIVRFLASAALIALALGLLILGSWVMVSVIHGGPDALWLALIVVCVASAIILVAAFHLLGLG